MREKNTPPSGEQQGKTPETQPHSAELGQQPAETVERTRARLELLQKYNISRQPDYVVDVLVRHQDQMPSFDDVPDPEEVNRISAVIKTIAERDANEREIAAVSLTLEKVGAESGQYHWTKPEYKTLLGEPKQEGRINKFRKTNYERGEQNPTVYLSSTLGSNSVERRQFQDGKLQEAVELSAYNDGTRAAEIVKPIQTKDGQTIYITLYYSEWERHSSGLGTVKRAKSQPFLPDIQVSFGSHKGTDATVEPEDWYIETKYDPHTRGNAQLEKPFKEVGIAESNRRTWMRSPSDRKPPEIEVRDNTFVLKFDDDLLSGEVEFPKELDFEALYNEWQERIAS